MIEINYSAKERAKNVLMGLKETCIENGDLEAIGAIEVYDDLIEQLLVHMDAVDFVNQELRKKLDKLKVASEEEENKHEANKREDDPSHPFADDVMLGGDE